VIESLVALEFSDREGESPEPRITMPTTFTAEEGAEIERILKLGAPPWVLAIRKRLGR
jgi:hypothetical protein